MAEEDEGEGRKNRTKDYATPPTCGTETVGGVMIRKCQIERESTTGYSHAHLDRKIRQ